MIMRPGQPLLLPVNPPFIWSTLVLALLFNILPLGRHAWIPDPLALVLVFWNVQQPRRVGIAAAFVFGLCIDVHQTALLGQHALTYSVLSYLAIMIHRRLLWFALPTQALQVLPLFVTATVLELLIRLLSGGAWPGWSQLLAPLLQALLWPLASVLLLVPQRRAPDPDENRPL